MSSENEVREAIAGTPGPATDPWPARIESFKKFSKVVHDRGARIEKRYEDARDDVNQALKRVNIFYSNVTIIKESLYNSLPKPTATRLHRGDWDNEPARVAATIVERALAYEVACAPHFNDAIKAAILDRLVPGVGTVWVNFDAELSQITVDLVYWRDFIYEPSRSWDKVTWAGRYLDFTKEEATKRWGSKAVVEDKEGQFAGEVESAILSGKVRVIQMWDKNTKKVYYLNSAGDKLQEIDDPYMLKGFFPTPKPLIASPPTSKFLPLADYYMAQDQYRQLDTIYQRMALIVEAVRVCGVYDASNPSLARMLSGNENSLIPVDNWAMFAEKGGVKGSIDWFPVEQVVKVLGELVSNFEFVKNQLFEVTGMADIVRGSSNQYETLGAQQIKAQFASVRMNGFQRDVSFFVRDVLRIIAELACQLYDDQKLSQIVGQLPQEDQQYVQQALAILRNDVLMHYNVDIEPDSLTQADWGLQQEQRLAYGQSLSQFITSALPVAQQMPQLQPLLVQIIKFMSVGFKGSSELEGVLDNTLNQLSQQPPEQNQEPSPEEVKAKAEAEKVQMEIQAKQQDSQIKLQEAEQMGRIKLMQAEQELQFKKQMQEMELQFKQQMHQMELNNKMELARIQAETVRHKAETEQEIKDRAAEREESRKDVSTAAEIGRSEAAESASSTDED